MTRLLALLLPLALVATGCSGDGGAASDRPTTATSKAAPAAAPKVGACYLLDVASALRATNDAEPVPCSGKHTSRTVYVGTVDPTYDGHLLAVDSTRVQRQIADRCRAKVDDHVGGSQETQRLSRVQAVWFSPSLAQSDRGALWFRCDLVVGSTAQRFADLPRRTRGLLARGDALGRWGTCGTAAPGTDGFTRVLCSAKHTWRARATIELPPGTRYLARPAGKAADSACRDEAARRAADVLKFRWSFEWPTRAQWNAGQRYGYCWLPD